MGMIATFRRLSDADLSRLLSDPNLVDDYVGCEEPPEDFGPFAELDIDKAWHAIHFLLTGTAWEGEPPLNFVVAGGNPIGEVDLGYGPARGFSSAEVQAIASGLESITPAEIRARFSPKSMMAAEIYPEIWVRSPDYDDDTCGYVVEYYESLREFVLGAAQEREALLAFMS